MGYSPEILKSERFTKTLQKMWKTQLQIVNQTKYK